jgi:hypothetical protein
MARSPEIIKWNAVQITQAVNAVIDGLEAIEAHPAVRMTPDQFGQAIARTGRELMNEVAQKYDRARQDAERERHQLAGMIGTMRGQDKQLRVLCWTGGIVLVVGLILSPFIASVLPFGLNTRVAALVMNNDRWDAGWLLLDAADPAGRQDAAAGFNLVQANRAALANCQRAAVNEGKDQQCTVIVRGQ